MSAREKRPKDPVYKQLYEEIAKLRSELNRERQVRKDTDLEIDLWWPDCPQYKIPYQRIRWLKENKLGYARSLHTVSIDEYIAEQTGEPNGYQIVDVEED